MFGDVCMCTSFQERSWDSQLLLCPCGFLCFYVCRQWIESSTCSPGLFYETLHDLVFLDLVGAHWSLKKMCGKMPVLDVGTAYNSKDQVWRHQSNQLILLSLCCCHYITILIAQLILLYLLHISRCFRQSKVSKSMVQSLLTVRSNHLML